MIVDQILFTFRAHSDKWPLGGLQRRFFFIETLNEYLLSDLNITINCFRYTISDLTMSDIFFLLQERFNGLVVIFTAKRQLY